MKMNLTNFIQDTLICLKVSPILLYVCLNVKGYIYAYLRIFPKKYLSLSNTRPPPINTQKKKKIIIENRHIYFWTSIITWYITTLRSRKTIIILCKNMLVSWFWFWIFVLHQIFGHVYFLSRRQGTYKYFMPNLNQY